MANFNPYPEEDALRPAPAHVRDRDDPQARAYAKQRLMAAVRAGYLPRYLPEWDVDPTAAWRGISKLMAQGGYFNQSDVAGRQMANQQARPQPTNPVAVPPGVPGMGGGPQPTNPMAPPGIPGVGGPQPTNPINVPQGVPGLGDGTPMTAPHVQAAQQSALLGAAPTQVRIPRPGPSAHQNNDDWRGQIRAMSHAINPTERLSRPASQGFGFQTGGGAEAALNRLQHVGDVHRTATALASVLGARRRTRLRPFHRT